ncbi:calcium/sodium antiporter [Clostridium gasigenes]|uniref:Cation:H+ antiporter n=1 Tax=Clostridium gasigenes TaxID=94869 RepID=A0A1H0M3U5_9CLOT|nr:calcium/sodium antiporter [Clostridium gasigenes]MBB6622278.1 calcium/sodium antiporter [Clostridium gasigenes]MBU3087058.1 calcium/sodium antiporter [Clostridium gasigenes]SDO74810.1 cation:H+ antiporter [Clostridium gasigenes]
MSYILLIIGFVLLIKGADIFVDGASEIAKKFKIPEIIVGLTIVSIGTSAPELAVSIISSLKGSNEITMGNIIGSNIFNTLMVLGITSIIMPIVIKKSSISKDFIITVIVAVLLLVLTFGDLLWGGTSQISTLNGIVLLILCIGYLLLLLLDTKKSNSLVENIESEEPQEEIKILTCIIKILIGVAGVVSGGEMVVNAATNIATTFGMSQKLIGLTIIAVGTSLPELVTSIIAAIKGKNDIALGNVFGSNIFNMLLILGTAASINPIPVLPQLGIDLIFLIVVTLILGGFMFVGKKGNSKLSRKEGLILVLMYVVYIIYIVIRN